MRAPDEPVPLPAHHARVRVARSADLEPAEWTALTALCEAAFEESWGSYWEAIGPALHAMSITDAGIVAHACLVERELHTGPHRLLAGYVEAVATRPDLQGGGLATGVLRVINAQIRASYRLGALSTGLITFYERMGWEPWRGPTFIRMPDGELLRTADDDGGIMILRTPSTPGGLDVDAPISAEWRPGELW